MGTFQHHGGMAIRGLVRVGELPDDVLGDADDDDGYGNGLMSGWSDDEQPFAPVTTNGPFIKTIAGIGLLHNEHNHTWTRVTQLHYIKWHAFHVDICTGEYECKTPGGAKRIVKCKCRRLIRVNALSHLQWAE